MRKIIIVSLVVLLSCSVFGKSIMTFSKTKYDFRTISKDSVATITFKYLNTGKDTLEISKIYTSCHCTQAIAVNKRVAPRKIGAIVVQFRAMHEGKFKEQIIICNKGYKKPVYLKIKGNAI